MYLAIDFSSGKIRQLKSIIHLSFRKEIVLKISSSRGDIVPKPIHMFFHIRKDRTLLESFSNCIYIVPK